MEQRPLTFSKNKILHEINTLFICGGGSQITGHQVPWTWIKCKVIGFSIKGLSLLTAVNKGPFQNSSPTKKRRLTNFTRTKWNFTNGCVSPLASKHHSCESERASESPKSSWMSERPHGNMSPGRAGTIWHLVVETSSNSANAQHTHTHTCKQLHAQGIPKWRWKITLCPVVKYSMV